MPYYTRNTGKEWKADDVKELRNLPDKIHPLP
jgi:hypothetical protein